MSLWRLRFRRPVWLLALALAACGAPEADDASDEVLPVDTTLAVIVADLHLADARAETTGEPRDSLRSAVFATHQTDSARVAERLNDETRNPDATSAFYGAVSERLDPILPFAP